MPKTIIRKPVLRLRSSRSPSKDRQPTLPRGFTSQALHSPESRPPGLIGRVYNEFRPDVARGSTMPPPTDDTEEPRMSKRGGKGLKKGRR